MHKYDDGENEEEDWIVKFYINLIKQNNSQKCKGGMEVKVDDNKPSATIWRRYLVLHFDGIIKK